MWSAGSGDFGTRLRWAGLDEVLFLGRAPRPTCVLIRKDGDDVRISLEDATDLLGLTTHEKIMRLGDRYGEAHFAVIGPAGEHYESVYYAAIALSTGNQLRSRDEKPRFAGRGGMGGILGSKNVLAIVAQAPLQASRVSDTLKEINQVIARGPGSRKFRDPDKADGQGGTWSNCVPLFEAGALPERNFWPTGGDEPTRLFRETLEEHYVIKDESCFKCGIACHKNIYESEIGRAGRFRAKVDYEPLDLLSLNLGLYDREQALEMIALNDQLGCDSISAGVVLGYVMEYNERHPDAPLANGARFGDFEKAAELLRQIAAGEQPDLGKGVKHLSEQVGETAYAMHCKGLELPAYLPETNPGYPLAIAGGHMSMRTFLLYVTDGDTSLDYWEEAIVEKGLYQVRDDLIGLCKFAGLDHSLAARAISDLTGCEVSEDDLKAAVLRTFLRGYALERKQGFTEEDYALPERTYQVNPAVQLPHFVTPEFFAELRARVLRRFDAQVADLGLP
jgi:aldehyde:ferredoxin oxidoreductase